MNSTLVERDTQTFDKTMLQYIDNELIVLICLCIVLHLKAALVDILLRLFLFVKYFFISFNSYFGVNVKLDDYLWLWIIGFSIFIGLYSSNQSMKRNLNE